MPLCVLNDLGRHALAALRCYLWLPHMHRRFSRGRRPSSSLSYTARFSIKSAISKTGKQSCSAHPHSLFGRAWYQYNCFWQTRLMSQPYSFSTRDHCRLRVLSVPLRLYLCGTLTIGGSVPTLTDGDRRIVRIRLSPCCSMPGVNWLHLTHICGSTVLPCPAQS